MSDRNPLAGQTALDLNAIETRALVATPGPWKHSIGTVRGIDGIHEHVVADRPVDGFDVIAMTGRMDEHPRSVLDAEFIARSREDVPALIAEIKRLRAEALEAVIADRHSQSSDPAVIARAEEVLTSIVRNWPGGPPAQAWIRRAATEVLRDTAWIRPAAPGCDCSATGGQGLVPSASREHADDCPAVAR